MKKSICFVAQFPPPIHGLSKAVDTLYNSKLRNIYNIEVIDIVDNKKIIGNILKILKSKSELYYFTISQSKFGNLRDLLIMNIILMKNKKLIVHIHGGYLRKLIDNDCKYLQKRINYRLLSKISAGIVLSECFRNIFQGIIEDSKIKIVYNCVDDEFVISDEEYILKENNIREKEIINILFLSNFMKEKGYRELLNLIKRLREKDNYKFKFTFAGKFFKKEDEKYFFEFIKANQLEEIIDYRGVVNGKQKRDLLRDSDIFFLLTTHPTEGQPISIIEAICNGSVVISTNSGSIPELVIDNKGGYIVEPTDYDLMEKILLDLYNNREILSNLSKFNRNRYLEYFKESMYIENIEQIFKEVLKDVKS